VKIGEKCYIFLAVDYAFFQLCEFFILIYDLCGFITPEGMDHFACFEAFIK